MNPLSKTPHLNTPPPSPFSSDYEVLLFDFTNNEANPKVSYVPNPCSSSEADRKRAHKEARTSLHKRPGNRRSSRSPPSSSEDDTVSSKHLPPPSTQPGSSAQIDPGSTDVEFGICCCQEDKDRGIYWNGKRVNDSAVVRFAPQGTVLSNVVSAGPGYALQAPGGREVQLLTSCWGANGFLPLLERLYAEHAVLRNTREASQLQTILAIAGSYGMYPPIVQTAKDYISYRQNEVRVFQDSIRLQNGEIVAPICHAPAIAHYPDCYRDGQPWRIDFTPCEPNAPFRARSFVTSITHRYLEGGHQVTKTTFGNNVNEQTVKFTKEECKTRYCTAYFRFVGVNQQPFVWYDISNHSMEVGVKRIIGARDGEAEFQANEDLMFATWRKLMMEHSKRTGFGKDGQLEKLFALVSNPRRCRNARGNAIHIWVAERFFELYFSRSHTPWIRGKLDTLYGAWDDTCDHLREYLDEGFDTLWSFFGRDLMRTIPHVKKKLRSAYVDGIKLHDRLNDCVKRVEAHVKEEIAKPLKNPRLFVSYDAGCMYANHIPELIKLVQNGTRVVPLDGVGGDIRFEICVLSYDVGSCLHVVIQNLMDVLDNASDRFHACIFSDDMVIVGSFHGQKFAYNVDISSCDASNGSYVFGVLGCMIAGFNIEEAYGLISQCCKPIILRSIDKSEQFTIKLARPFEGSGTVLTTILNNCASISIVLAIIYLINESRIDLFSLQDDGSIMEDTIKEGACAVGHKVTVENVAPHGMVIHERIQFLKYSPMMSISGEYVPTLNYGCIFRSLGVVVGDMLPEQLGVLPEVFSIMTTSERADRFFGAVVAGLVHEPQSRIMHALRTRFNCTQANPVECKHLQITTERSHFILDEESIKRRYGVSDADIDELVVNIENLKVGDCIACYAITRFYEVDYGLPQNS